VTANSRTAGTDAEQLIAGVSFAGTPFLMPAPPIDFSAGDRRYFRYGVGEAWSLRPAIVSDLPDGLWMRAGVWLLSRAFPDINLTLRVLTQLPTCLRRSGEPEAVLALKLMGERGSIVGNVFLHVEAQSHLVRIQSTPPNFPRKELLVLEHGSVAERQMVEEAVEPPVPTA